MCSESVFFFDMLLNNVYKIMKYIWQEYSFCSYTIPYLVIHFFIHFQSAHSLIVSDTNVLGAHMQCCLHISK